MNTVISVLLGVLASANPQTQPAALLAEANRPSAISVKALADLLMRDSPTAVDPRRLRGREDVIPLLEKDYGSLEPKIRRRLVLDVLNVGIAPDAPQMRWSFSSGVARFLVGVLKTEKDAEIRNRVARMLLEHVPDIYVRSHAEEIMAAVKENEPDDAILLLGKTGCAAARELLLGNEKLRRVSLEKTDMALAKLGDTERSRKFVEAFESEKDPQKKARLAQCLGYIGDAASVLALAREMRSDVTVPGGGHFRSLRVDISKALNETFPEAPVFWVHPIRTPSGDEWYEKMETWLEAYLKITWSKPRPAFFYIQIIPTPVPPPPRPT